MSDIEEQVKSIVAEQLDQEKEILNKVELIKYFLGELGLKDEDIRRLLANQSSTEDVET